MWLATQQRLEVDSRLDRDDLGLGGGLSYPVAIESLNESFESLPILSWVARPVRLNDRQRHHCDIAPIFRGLVGRPDQMSHRWSLS